MIQPSLTRRVSDADTLNRALKDTAKFNEPLARLSSYKTEAVLRLFILASGF
jgi:hypothetical protein